MKFLKTLGAVALLSLAAIGLLTVVGTILLSSSIHLTPSTASNAVSPDQSQAEVVKSSANTEAVSTYHEVTGTTTVQLPVIYLDSNFGVAAGYTFSGKNAYRPPEVDIYLAHVGHERRWSGVDTVYLSQGETRANYEVFSHESKEKFESVSIAMPISVFQQFVEGSRLLILVGNDTLGVSGDNLQPFKIFSSQMPGS